MHATNIEDTLWITCGLKQAAATTHASRVRAAALYKLRKGRAYALIFDLLQKKTPL